MRPCVKDQIKTTKENRRGGSKGWRDRFASTQGHIQRELRPTCAVLRFREQAPFLAQNLLMLLLHVPRTRPVPREIRKVQCYMAKSKEGHLDTASLNHLSNSTIQEPHPSQALGSFTPCRMETLRGLTWLA